MADIDHHGPKTGRLLTTIALERLVQGGSEGRRVSAPEDASDLTRPTLLERFGDAIQASLTAGNGPAWLMVAFGAGLIAYFALPYEPALWALYPTAGILTGLAWRARFSAALYGALVVLFLVLGVILGAQTARLADAPQVLEEMTGSVTGRVVRLEQRTPTRARLTLDNLTIEDLAPGQTPRRVRLTVIAEPGVIAPGDEVDVLARLGPPPEPVMPGARNLRRELYFDGIGATGFSFGRPTRVESPSPQGIGQASLHQASLHQAIERLRLNLAERFKTTLSADTGTLAATLLVGKRDGLSEESYEALRRAGLAHLLAISGMHMAMMTLSAIAAINGLLALHPSASAARVTMRWAAAAGLVIATGYLMLSGAGTATQRAFVMIVIVLVAMIASRRALTIRGVAFAAFIVLLLHPESLLGPSFQMSFAATLALVAFYGAFTRSNWVWRWRHRLQAGALSPVLRPLSVLSGIALTSLIAGLATAPFAAYHFSVGAPLGLLGNVLALPLVSLIIMPAGLLALLLTPFALEAAPLLIMGAGIDMVMVIARWVASLDGSRVPIAAITPEALLLMTLAGCLAALFVGKARLLAILVLMLLPVWGFFQPTPHLIVERRAATVAYVADPLDGNRYLDRSVRRGSRFSVDMWHQRLALDSDANNAERQWICDPLGCTLTLPGGKLVAHVLAFAALQEDCRLADVLITPLTAPRTCEADIVVDRQVLREHGAVALVADQHGKLSIWPSFDRRTRPWEMVAD